MRATSTFCGTACFDTDLPVLGYKSLIWNGTLGILQPSLNRRIVRAPKLNSECLGPSIALLG